jgi:hypothetical protein
LYVFRHPEFGGTALAKKYGVSKNVVSCIVNRRSY